jgi:hypothetical protein
MDTSPPATQWRDVMLERSARGRVDLPMVSQERGRGGQQARSLKFAALAAIVLFVANAAIFFGTGRSFARLIDPKLRDPSVVTTAGVVLLGIPLAVALLIYAIFWFRTVRGVRDADGHPLRIDLSEQELAITRADGMRLAAPWARWRWERYTFASYNGAPIGILSFVLSLDGRSSVLVDLRRAPRPRRLLRAVLQRLAANGRATG